MKSKFFLGAMLLAAISVNATIYTTNWSTGFVNGTTVPDNNLSGWSETRSVSTMPAGTLQGVAVDLELTGGWNGDLYAYLVHDAGFSVLLNRVGMGETGVGAFGYGDAGMDVTLTASGTSIHQYGGINNTFPGSPAVNSVWAADGGNLGSFLTTSPNGTWTLFVADLSGGGVTTVQSWGLQMDIVAVPEVETWVAAALAGAFGAFWLNRQIWKGVKPPQQG